MVRDLQWYDMVLIRRRGRHCEYSVKPAASPVDRPVYQCILRSHTGHDIYSPTFWQVE